MPFSFFQNFGFLGCWVGGGRGVGGGKEQKEALNDKKNCVTLYLRDYLIVVFGTHV